MKEIQLTDLRSLSGVVEKSPDKENRSFSNVSIDSRTINKDDIFFAIRGENHDGHKFIPEVISKGVTTLVVNNDFEPGTGAVDEISGDFNLFKVPDTSEALRELANIHRRKFNIPIIGITGTNGKTTTKEMISSLLSLKLNIVRSRGNFNNLYGLPLTIFNITSDTEAAVLEMGASIPGEIGKLCKIAEPDYGLITNIGRGHIEFFKSKDEVLNTKSVLLSSASVKGFINGDDPMLATLKKDMPELVTFGLGNHNDLFVSKMYIMENGGYSFRLKGEIDCRLNVPGKMNVFNALAAVSIARELGISDEDIVRGLGAFRSYNQRLEILYWQKTVIINDTYNANPDSMRAAIDILSEYPSEGRKYALLGDMLELGDTCVEEHLSLGRYLKQKNITGVITVGERARKISEAGEKEKIDFSCHASDHDEAAGILRETLKDKDVLLVKGSRGSRMEKSLSALIEQN